MLYGRNQHNIVKHLSSQLKKIQSMIFNLESSTPSFTWMS